MASGLDFASGILSVISVSFQTLQGCIQGYRFIQAAQSIGKDGDFLRERLLFEQIRLQEWAERAGLDGASLGNLRLNWEVINEILKQKRALLTSVERLKTQYGLKTYDEEVREDMESKSGSSPHGPSERGIEQFFARLRPDPLTKSARRIQTSNGTLRRIKWAVVGRDDTRRIVTDLGLLNDQLVQLLENAESGRINERLDALLRGVLSLCTQPSEVETFQHLLGRSEVTNKESLAAAAALKNLRLVIGVDKRDDEIRPHNNVKTAKKLPRLTIINERKLVHKDKGAQKGITLAEYGKFPVLVQWKQASAATWALMEKQMKRLALLLSSASDPSFHCLPCLGLLPLENKRSFGLVYSIPSQKEAEHAVALGMSTLYDLIDMVPKLSLSLRLGIARNMAEAVFQLHTAGWLHKGIRSYNVVFLAAKGTSAQAMLATPSFLIGYDHARPDTDTAATEMAETPVEADLYRHPHCRGSNRERFAKQFDVYALGCLLVELALWRKLKNVHSKYAAQDWGELIAKAEAEGTDIELPALLDLIDETDFINDIKHNAGDGYWDTVRMCLSVQASSTTDQEASLDLQLDVLKKLQACTLHVA